MSPRDRWPRDGWTEKLLEQSIAELLRDIHRDERTAAATLTPVEKLELRELKKDRGGEMPRYWGPH